MWKAQAGFALQQCSLQLSAAHVFPVADVLASAFGFGFTGPLLAFSAAFEAFVLF